MRKMAKEGKMKIGKRLTKEQREAYRLYLVRVRLADENRYRWNQEFKSHPAPFDRRLGHEAFYDSSQQQRRTQ